MDKNTNIMDLIDEAEKLGVSKTEIDSCNKNVDCIENLIKYKKLVIEAEKNTKQNQTMKL